MPAKILLVEDEPALVETITYNLRREGYEVLSATDGADGLRVAQSASPDLVVLDFIMPGLSGAEVARRVRQRHPDQPILFVSGYSETDAVKTVAPDAALLAKPFRAEALHKAVRGALTPGG